MNFFESILLGIIQGATEFFPVSSSGHLIIFRKIFNITEMSLILEVALHIGTLFSILFFWFNDYVKEIKKVASGNIELLIKVFIGCLPAAIVGFFFKDSIRQFFYDINSTTSYLIIAYMFMSLLLFITRLYKNNKNDTISYMHALLIGVMQAVAIIPGISRSGITIAAALILGISFKKSMEFSFMLVVPILIFAGFDTIISEYNLVIKDANLFLGIISSFLSGYFFLSLLNKIIINNKFWFFSFYCLLISILLLSFSYGQ